MIGAGELGTPGGVADREHGESEIDGEQTDNQVKRACVRGRIEECEHRHEHRRNNRDKPRPPPPPARVDAVARQPDQRIEGDIDRPNGKEKNTDQPGPEPHLLRVERSDIDGQR